ncbi:MAG TPA: zeta toxin family protein [Candidatus Paceibacterota bacterium]|nr:zeta toxin family protein [Candidatus Paceibacterota bacterium]
MRLEDYITEGINDKGIFKACFMCGSAGSGKSYTLSKVKSGSIEPRIVNTDKVFPMFKQWWNTDWGKIKLKVKTINKNQLAGYINSMLPLAVDGTAGKPSVILKRIGLLEYFGYDVGMLFINTSLETAIERASKRERQVDKDFIIQVHKEVEAAKNFYRGKFSTWMEINNDEGMLTDKVITNAFKFMSKFYDGPLQNPVGKQYKEQLIKSGEKYLSPTILSIEKIKNTVDAWYAF